MLQTAGLSNTQAPFVEEARERGELYITQPYQLYSEENHRAWELLYSRMLPRWERYANCRFCEGLAKLNLDRRRVPRLEEVNEFLNPLTGFRARAVSGYIPAFQFFDCLRKREFPTTITIRPSDRLDYLPEPDIFHDIAGHVPMHTDRAFADALVRFGECAHTAAEIAAATPDSNIRILRLTSIVRALARFFWFTVEFGLMRQGSDLRAYGSGLLSSHGELEYALTSPDVQRHDVQLEWIVNQGFEIHHYQPLLFVIGSFEHLFTLVGQLEQWMKSGKLNNVAPGEPEVSTDDLASFLRHL